jgi:hypothetical protein
MVYKRLFIRLLDVLYHRLQMTADGNYRATPLLNQMNTGIPASADVDRRTGELARAERRLRSQ